MVGLSVPELALIGGIALVVFGPSKLPEMGAALGKAIREFKQAMQEPEPEKKIVVEQIQEPQQIEALAQKEDDSLK